MLRLLVLLLFFALISYALTQPNSSPYTPIQQLKSSITFEKSYGSGKRGLVDENPVKEVVRVQSNITSINPSNGPEMGGTLVAIKGPKLANDLEDIINVTTAGSLCTDIVFIDQGTIECITGPVIDSYRGFIVVTTISSGIIASDQNVLYTYNKAPYIIDSQPTNGPLEGGTHIVLKGNEFGKTRFDLSSITLNGVPCTQLEYTNSSLIGCTSGKASYPGFGRVVVATISGGYSTSEVYYRYNSPPLVTSITPANGPPSGNTTVMIVGDFFGRNPSDIIDVIIANVSCRSTLRYFNESLIFCATGSHPNPYFIQQGEVYVITTSGGNGIVNENALFTYNAAPTVNQIIPHYGLTTGFTIVQIMGSNFGESLEDISDITISGHSCLYSARWQSKSSISCMTPQVVHASTGDIIVTTRSGGRGISHVQFTYQPVCSFQTSEESCMAGQCSWCASSFSCLGDVKSCPSDCRGISCASLVLSCLLIGIIITIIIGAVIVISFVIHDAAFKNQIKSLSKSQKKS